MEPVYVAAMIVLAVVLAWPVPRLLPRLTRLRTAPGSALLLWQSCALAAVLAGLLSAPLAMLELVRTDENLPGFREHLLPAVVGLVIAGIMLVRLLLRGHRVGTDLRRRRREHAELVDLIGLDDASQHPDVGPDVRVLAHPTPTAYCVPGECRRVVLTQGTLDALDDRQLTAVLAHERSHLRGRHDLVLEFFSVLHSAVPKWIRSGAGLREVRLLIELFADRWAVRATDRRTVGTALAALASGAHPDEALGVSEDAIARVEQLADKRRTTPVHLGALVASVLVLQAPLLLAVLALRG